MGANLLDQKLNALIENVFLITINREVQNKKQLVYLEDIAAGSQLLMSLETLEMALFERLMLSNPKDYLIPSNIAEEDVNPASIEEKAITYLFDCFCRNERSLNQNDSVNTENCNKIQKLIMRNVSTAIKQPAIFSGQNLSVQLADIFKDTNQDYEAIARFLNNAFKEVLKDDETDGYRAMMVFIFPILIDIHTILKKSSLGSMETWIIPTLMTFVSDKTNPQLAEVVLDYTTPPEHSDGSRYSESLLGQLLSISIMPKTHNGPYEFFDNLQSVNVTTFQNMSGTLWIHLNRLHDDIHLLIKGFLLVGGNSKEKMLKWMGNALHANRPRGQIWNAHGISNLGLLTSAPDSFMIGFTSVLLRLCKPLFRPLLKVFLVDPTYCAVTEDKKVEKSVHMKGVSKETCLLPTDENEQRLTADTYNFITEIFYMTHKAIDLGYRVCIEKLIQTNRELHQIQSAYQDTIAQGGTDVAANIMQLLTSKTQSFLCLQNLLIEPNNDQLLMQFYEATSLWLIQILHKSDKWYILERSDKGYAPLTVEENIGLAKHDYAPPILKSIPEFLLENIVVYMTFTHHFDQQQSLKINSEEAQNAIFTMILTFMGSTKRVRNPHVRARLAEGLESLLPDVNKLGYSSSDTFFLRRHPHRLYIVENLLNVFVSIEMTGQSVQFEQKFNYRRPIIAIMEFLWQIPEQQQCFKELEQEAINKIDDVEPPIFLRFVNLLMNDAIFLLDESFETCKKIRDLQEAQDRGEWDDLSDNERRQNLESLRQLSSVAKYNNLLGRESIKILKLLTTTTKNIFTHASMVNRIASFCNYFLLHLVGPKKKKLNVKDKKELEFDPAFTVQCICCIYKNLGDCDSFCLAVANDYSYSSKLFEDAEEILIRIGGGDLIVEISEFAEKINLLEKQQKEDEIALSDPPEEFLDPIMSTLMRDPVVLPSSKINIDRCTLQRHLLSDQIDPFNRAPLTMDQVRPNLDLKRQIEEWIAEKRSEYRTKTNGSDNAE